VRAVFVEVPEEVVRHRRQLDLDRFDEMWEGELHMSPFPSWEHQRIAKDLTVFFTLHWEQLGEGACGPNVGVKPPGTPDLELAGEKTPANYRGPDLVFLLTGNEDRIQGGWVVGAPDAVIEVRSPGDETYQKLPFYHRLGVSEVIVIQRDSRAVEIHRRGPAEYERVVPEPNGSVPSQVLDTVFRAERGPDGKPVLRLHRGRMPDRQGMA